MRKIMIALLICSVCIISSVGCHSRQDSKEIQTQANKPEKLVIYISGAENVIQTEEESLERYPTPYSFGLNYMDGSIDDIQGNIFCSALKKYGEENGIEMDIHFLRERSENGESNTSILQSLYEADKLPDLVIASKQEHLDYYRLQAKNLLHDWSGQIETDETIDGEEYYDTVLNGGRIEDHQVIMPLLFNLNGMITNESYMQKIGAANPQIGDTFEDFIYILQKSCTEAAQEKYLCSLYEYSGHMSLGNYLPSILLSAAYTSYVSEDDGSFDISEDVWNSIWTTMELFQKQDFCNIQGWEENSYQENVDTHMAKSQQIRWMNEKELVNQIGIFLSGGRGGGFEVSNSLLMDAMYFNSVYAENDEKMVMAGIPTAESSSAYSANISYLAFSPADIEYPETVYDLIRYLMDYEFSPFYGFSTNREVTQKQLENVKTTTITTYPDLWSALEGGFIKMEDLENRKIVIQPLNEEGVQTIEYMLENIAGAGFSFNLLEYSLVVSAIEQLGNEQKSSQELGTWINEKLDQYWEKDAMNINPFTDWDYENELMKP